MLELRPPAPAPELLPVPLSYALKDYNLFNGTELPDHNSLLSSEQAEAINNAFDLSLYVGAHYGAGGSATGLEREKRVPSELEYEQALLAVADLQPWDVLYIEGLDVSRPEYSSLREYSLLERGRLREQLEGRRRNGGIDAFQYAARTAWLNGVRVVHADLNPFDLIPWKERAGIAVGDDLVSGLLRQGDNFMRELHAQREKRAWEVVKGDALAHMPSASTLDAFPNGVKPKLRLLYGFAHKEALEEGASNLGLQISTHVLKWSSIEEREAAMSAPKPGDDMSTTMERSALAFARDLGGIVAMIAAMAKDRGDKNPPSTL